MAYNQAPLRYAAAAIGVAAIVCCGFLLKVASAPNTSSAAARSTIGVLPSVPSSPDGPVPASIHATMRRGSVSVALTISPVDVGSARFSAKVTAAGKPITRDRVRLRLSMPSQPIFGVSALTMTQCGTNYCGQGQLQALGRWHVEARVCGISLANVCAYIPFDFMNGANSRFLFAQSPDTQFGPASVVLTRSAQGASLLRARLRPGLSVRAVLVMPNMLSMGSAIYAARTEAPGRYAVSLAFPMTGVMQVTLQVHVPNGWRAVRMLLYDADSAGNATLITNTPS